MLMQLLLAAGLTANAAVGNGTLSVHPANPIWFSDGGGRALWLGGSHTWATFQERGVKGVTPDFDYPGWLDFMTSHGQNFLRLWTWEQAQWMQFAKRDVHVRYEPLPYPRTGPGLALDGQPKFDLGRFNEACFTRLRERVEAAGQAGIYVSVMLFQGFSVEQKGTKGVDPNLGNPWDGHPFNQANNLNGINGDPDGDGEGLETHTLAVPEVTRLQEAYVRKVVDTLNDLPFITWEIGNECHPGSIEWQSYLTNCLREYETKLPRQHLIGITGAPIKNDAMYASPADWISPVNKIYLEDPPVNDGRKIVVVDTDHISPWGHDPSWVWKNFLRGNHVWSMDGYMDFRMDSPSEPQPQFEEIRQALGDAVAVSQKVDLARLRPHPELASTRYCLAEPGREYLVYLPDGGQAKVQLAAGELKAFWFSTTQRSWSEGSITGGQEAELTTPFDGSAVVHLVK